MLSSGSGDSCEYSGDAPPTMACDADPNRLSAVFPAPFRISSGTRPTDGMYAGGYPQSSPKTTRCCGILPTATTISGQSAIFGAPHRPACGSAADTRWTPCGRHCPRCPRCPASGAYRGPSERGPARSIARVFYRWPWVAGYRPGPGARGRGGSPRSPALEPAPGRVSPRSAAVEPAPGRAGRPQFSGTPPEAVLNGNYPPRTRRRASSGAPGTASRRAASAATRIWGRRPACELVGSAGLSS
jgi:hypothetical protein